MGPCVRRDDGKQCFRNSSEQSLADHFLDGGEFLIGLVELGLGGLRTELGGERVIFGDLFLADIRAYREQKLAGTGITPVFPLWDRPTLELAQAMMASGLEAYLATVDMKKLSAEFAGRKFDSQLLADLPEGVDPCGENGEFHTCVVAGPMFAHRLAVHTGERVERDGYAYCDLVLA